MTISPMNIVGRQSGWHRVWPYIGSLMMLTCLWGCSEDSEEVVRQRVNLESLPCAIGYEEEAETRAVSLTRSEPPIWIPKDDQNNPLYFLYDDLNGKFAGRKDLMHKSISVFFAKNGVNAPDEGTFFYNDYDKKWHLNNMEVSEGNYYLYGFIPTEDAESATIVPNSNFEDGAVLTIHGLNAVTPSDVCVIIGAKDGTGENAVAGLQSGSFLTKLNATNDNTKHNYIFLLFDHLYSALRFQFLVDEDYAKLRTIKLRKLELIAYSDDSGGGVKAKYDAKITLINNPGGTPIVGDVLFSPIATSDDVAPVPLYDWDGTENTADDKDNEVILDPVTPTSFMGTFVPGDNVYFKLRSTYDVYDKAATPHLIRNNCQAENYIDLRVKFGSFLSTTRGHSYSFVIKVQPTYLYVLSDPDLDNPTVKIN